MQLSLTLHKSCSSHIHVYAKHDWSPAMFGSEMSEGLSQSLVHSTHRAAQQDKKRPNLYTGAKTNMGCLLTYMLSPGVTKKLVQHLPCR